MHPYSVIIVAHDQPRLLLGTLLHLRARAQPTEVIIVDNASEVDLTSVVQLSQLPASIIRIDDHHALGAAINLGIDAAAFGSLLVLHNDVHIETDPAVAIDYLANNPAVGIVGAKLFTAGSEPRKVRHIGYRVDERRLNAREIGREKWDSFWEPKDVSAVSTACMALRRTDLRFDERYWFDLEDVDFGLQHIQRRLAVVMHPELRAVHLEQGGVREQQTGVERGARMMASRWLYHERWCSETPIDVHPPQPALRGQVAIYDRNARLATVIGDPQAADDGALSQTAARSHSASW